MALLRASSRLSERSSLFRALHGCSVHMAESKTHPALDLADTHMMSHAEKERLGIPKKGPADKPGSFMHQRGSLSEPVTSVPPGRWWLRKELWPLWPLFGMVTLGLTLATFTGFWILFEHPEVYPRKRLREEFPELDRAEEWAHKGEEFAKQSPFRRLAHAGGPIAVLRQVFHEPPRLPGDEDVLTGRPAGKGSGPPRGGSY